MWSYSFFRQRRNDRKEWLRLYIKDRNEEETARYLALRHSFSSADSRHYHSLAKIEKRKILNHGYVPVLAMRAKCVTAHRVYCDFDGEDIKDVRIICMVCQATNTFDTVEFHDFPKECMTNRITREDLAKAHLPTHDLMKVRRVVHQRQFGKTTREAIEKLAFARRLLSGETNHAEEEDTDQEVNDGNHEVEAEADAEAETDADAEDPNESEEDDDKHKSSTDPPVKDAGKEIKMKAAASVAAPSVAAPSVVARTARSVISHAVTENNVKHTCAACGKAVVQPVWFCVHCEGQLGALRSTTKD